MGNGVSIDLQRDYFYGRFVLQHEYYDDDCNLFLAIDDCKKVEPLNRSSMALTIAIDVGKDIVFKKRSDTAVEIELSDDLVNETTKVAAELLSKLNAVMYHEYFVAASPVENGERAAKDFCIENHTTPLSFANLVAESIVKMEQRNNVSADALLHRITTVVKRLKKGGHQDV